MARIRKSPPQRQKSDRLQARAVTITPVHRESIIRPSHTSILHRASGTMAGPTAPASAATGDQNKHKRSTYPDDDSGWQTKWCAEPRNDAGACCLAYWVPAAMYGKVDWRLRRVAMGEDASEESFKCKYCFNVPCVAFCVVEMLFPRCIPSGRPPLKLSSLSEVIYVKLLKVMSSVRADDLDELGIFAGFQRAQIRGTYDIDGSVAVDFARGIFCTTCTLLHNDREIRAREGQESLRNNKKYQETLVTEQPKLHGAMKPIWGQRRPHAKRNLGVPFEPPQTNARTGTTRHRGGYQKARASPPRKTSQEQKNKATIMKSAQEFHPRSEHCHVKAMAKVQTTTATIAEKANPQTEQSHSKIKAGTEVTTRPDMKCERSDGRRRSQALKMMPTVVVTAPQDSNPSRRGSSVPSQTEQSGRSSVPGKSPLAKEHKLMDCFTVQMIQKVDSRTGQPTHRLVDFKTVEDIQKPTRDSHELINCNTITASSAVAQHQILTDCDNSTVSENQELSYVHDFTDCPVNKAILEYYEKQEKSFQSHTLAECAKISMDSPDKVVGCNSHNLENCSGRHSASTLLSNNPYLEHSLADCPGDGYLGSTATSGKRYRGAGNTMDGTIKTTRRGPQHRLSSCPTPIAASENCSSDDSQATETPTDLSAGADQRNACVSSDNGIGGSHLDYAEGQIHDRQRRRNKGKGNVNENITTAAGVESSGLAEHSAQHSLQQLLLAAEGKNENDGNSAELLKANLYIDPEGTVPSTLY